MKRFARVGGLRDSDVANLIGLGQWMGKTLGDAERASIREHVESLMIKLEKRRDHGRLPGRAFGNIAAFAKFTRLSATQVAVVTFVAVFDDDPVLRDAIAAMGHIDRAEYARLVGAAVGIPARTVMDALAPQGHLMRSGFLRWQTASSTGASVRFTRMAVAQHLLHETFAAEGVLRKVARPAPGAKLGVRDFPQLRETLSDLVAYLRLAISRRERGCNVWFIAKVHV